MEFLTKSLKEDVSKLSEDQREEVDIIESIVNTCETNKENTKEKLFHFLEKQKPENCLNFILGCFEHAAAKRPMEKESFFYLLTSIFNILHLNFEIMKKIGILRNILEVRNILPSNDSTNKHIFDFAEEETVGRAIF